MKTEFEYLRQLETDLADAAVREASRSREAATPARRRAGQMWIRVAGVAAAFIVVAGAIGFVFGGSGARDMFQEVGDAVSGGSGDADGGVPAALPAPPSEEEKARSPFEDQPIFTENLGGLGSEYRVREQQQLQDLSKIIRDGRVGIVVPDGKFGEAVGDLTFIAEQHGGFILSSATQNERSGTFVLRIPARRFDRALANVRDLGTRVKFQEIRGNDVTAEFIDFQARLRILQERRTLLSRLSEDATTTDEILRFASQIDDVHLRIEQIQGQIRFINDQVAESTLRVSIQERNAPEAVTQQEVDNPDLGSSFDLGVQGFLRIVGAVIIGLGYLIPLTVLGAVVWMAIWFARRRRATA